MPTCPHCGKTPDATLWTHPECPACHHANAVIDGTCRDCQQRFPAMVGATDWRCNYCRRDFRKLDTWAVASDDGRYVSGCLQTTSDLADADLFPRPDAERYAASLNRTEERLARLGHAPHTWTATLIP